MLRSMITNDSQLLRSSLPDEWLELVFEDHPQEKA
jgi:hypothetical protein